MTPATNTSRSPANCPPARDAGSSFVAITTTPKVPIRIPATFIRVIASRKKTTIKAGMMTTFTLTRRAVFVAIVRRIPSFWRSNPTALIAPRTQTRGSRNTRKSKRRIAASTPTPRSAPSVIRANVRKSGSTLPTASLLPGNDVPQRTLASKMRTASRFRGFTAAGRARAELSFSSRRVGVRSGNALSHPRIRPAGGVGRVSQPSAKETAPSAPKAGRGKIIAIVVAVLILVAIAAAAVYYLVQPTPTGIIKIGFTISKTGTYTVEGTNSLNGILAATAWVNAHGGVTARGTSYQLVLDYVDDQSQASNVPTLYAQIVTQDNAQFLLAPYSSPLTAPAAPIADQYGRVMLSHGGASNTIYQQGYQNVVGVLSPASMYLRGAIDYIKANHATDNLAFLYASDSFSSIAGSYAAAYAQSIGLNVVYNQSYPTSVTDLSTQLTAAKNAGADDLLGGGHFTDGVLVMQQLPGVSNNVTGPSQWERSVVFTPAIASAAGFEWYGPSGAEFTSLYGNMTNAATPTYHSAEAAAAIFVLAHAIQAANSLNTTQVRAELGSMKLMTFFGKFQVNSAGLQVAHEMIVDQWQAAALKVVWPTAVAVSPLQYPYTGG